MKRRHIDGSDWQWLGKHRSTVRRMTGSISGYASLVEITQVKKKLVVSSRNVDLCLADDGYSWLVFLPDEKNWCMTAMYDKQGGIIEWYFDITKENSVDESGIPYYDDLYLDIVLLPNSEIMIFDEDELKAALELEEITTEQCEMAYYVCHELIREKIVSVAYMVPFCERLLAVLKD